MKNKAKIIKKIQQNNKNQIKIIKTIYKVKDKKKILINKKDLYMKKRTK